MRSEKPKWGKTGEARIRNETTVLHRTVCSLQKATASYIRHFSESEGHRIAYKAYSFRLRGALRSVPHFSHNHQILKAQLFSTLQENRKMSRNILFAFIVMILTATMAQAAANPCPCTCTNNFRAAAECHKWTHCKLYDCWLGTEHGSCCCHP